MQVRVFPEIILGILLPIFLISEIIVLRIGLKLVKAEERKNFKFVIVSFIIQIVALVFINSPFIFMGLTGAFESGPPDPAIITIFILLSIFIEINLINAIHKVGIKAAVFIFILILIPIFIFGGLIGYLFTMANIR
ncbi:MAG: hypothetical protein ACOC35_04760 [Promethearchaeia archaeon]